MPDKAFAQSIQIAGEGYNAKLQGLMAIGQSIVHSETVKRQMADQLQAQKMLIDYRADAEVRKQQELAEMRAPAEQMKLLADSRKDATAKLDRLLERQSKDYFDVTSNNLNPFAPFVNINPSTGLYDLFIGNTETGDLVDYQTYLSDMDTLKADLAIITDLKNVLPDLPEDTSGVREDDLGRGLLNRRVGQEYISRWYMAKTPQEKQDIINDLRANWQEPSAIMSDDSRGGGRETSNHISVFSGLVNTNVDEHNNIRLVSMERQNWFGNLINKITGKTPEVYTWNMNFEGSSITQIRDQFAQMYDVYGLDLNRLGLLDDGTRAQIYAGDHRGLRGDDQDMAKTVAKILEEPLLAESFLKLNTFYNGFNKAIHEYRTSVPFSAATFSEDEYGINPNAERKIDFVVAPNGRDVTANAVVRSLGSTQ